MANDTDLLLNDKILENIMYLASRMLSAGGEVQRIEDTITRLCHAYGAARTDVFTINSFIAVTVYFEDRPSITQTRYVQEHSTDLTVLSQLNELSRYVCSNPCTADVWEEKLSGIYMGGNSLAAKVGIWALVSVSFAIFFGGSVTDAICSGLIGALLAILKNRLDIATENNYFSTIICGIAGSILGTAAAYFLPGATSFYINLGNIMLFIPGRALTLSIRDMFSGDTITGIMRFVETILISLLIAWSFALFSTRVLPEITGAAIWLQLVTSYIGTLSFGLMFHSKPKNAAVGAVGGLLSWMLVLLVQGFGFSEFIAYGIGTATVTLFSEIMARHFKAPATVFLTVGVCTMMPGRALYTTMNYAMQQEWDLFCSQGLTTLLYAFSMAAGIILITILFRAIQQHVISKQQNSQGEKCPSHK